MNVAKLEAALAVEAPFYRDNGIDIDAAREVEFERVISVIDVCRSVRILDVNFTIPKEYAGP